MRQRERETMNTQTKPGSIQYRLQENPGITGAVVAGLFGLLVKALSSYGINLTPEVEAFVTALIMVIFPIVGAYVARNWTTPLIRPEDNEGNALTPELPNVP